jgi:predicted RNase H-like nuclease
MSAMRVIGVDGCPQGWIAATVDFTQHSAGSPVVTDIHFDVHSHLATSPRGRIGSSTRNRHTHRVTRGIGHASV